MNKLLLVLCFVAFTGVTWAQTAYRNADGSLRVAFVKMPYRGARNVPDYLESGGLLERLRNAGVQLAPTVEIELTPEQKKEYGVWHRLEMANGHLGRLIAENQRKNYFSVGLLANCSSLMSMLAGLQDSGDSWKALRVGFVFIDAHGDFNTPETTLSGMLGGMPVVVSAGHPDPLYRYGRRPRYRPTRAGAD